MSKLTQRQAVFNATIKVLEDSNVSYDQGTDVKDVLTADHRTAINAIICEGFVNGTIELKDTPANQDKLSNPSKLKSYVSGLMSNWYRKDKALNGGSTYVTANPGSRTGQGDSQMKNLRALKKQFEAAGKDTKEIDEAITKRANELKASKAKTIEVDLNEIPAELKASLGIE